MRQLKAKSDAEHMRGLGGVPLTRAQLEVDGVRLRLFPNIALRKRIEDYEAEMESVAEHAARLAEKRVRVELRAVDEVAEARVMAAASRGEGAAPPTSGEAEGLARLVEALQCRVWPPALARPPTQLALASLTARSKPRLRAARRHCTWPT